jgi:undecaprenyl-diphosphatase
VARRRVARPSSLAGRPAVIRLLDRLRRAVLALDAATVDLVLAARHPLLTKAMTSVTGLGSASAAVVLLCLFLLAGWRREVRVAAPALLVSGVVVASLMAVVGRPFPPEPVCVTTGPGLAPHSFPSGHAAAATVFALVARRSSTLPFRPVAAVAVVVALSRLYLGTHFLSDTVAGVAVGVGAVVLVRRLLARRSGASPADPPGRPADD